ncbi:hypothetical protein [Dietzia sp. NCCP-2495]|uniref:hypothetical protein n=1 Tax=Dietzia sp. NCCP-2495 TaxID=2934675 RepID=UPI002232BE68|nr:hypothetical protein [Dietzia sp. NCCP-2495]
MSKRSDRAAERRAVKQARKDMEQAGTAARKAFDLKDPRFLGEAALAATRGPAGLALFGASRGVKALKEHRAQNAEILSDLAADAKQHADAIREQTSVLAAPKDRRSPLRRFAPLWITGLVGGAAIAGATAYFLRPGSSAPAATPPSTPATAGVSTGTTATADEASADATASQDDEAQSAAGQAPAGQSPAADTAAPGPAAGSAPQPSENE